MIADVAVVGAGIVGAATAYKLKRKYPYLSIVLLEKEPEPAFHQTGHNSGVIHSGIYYKPGSYKAKNCLDGRKQLVEFIRKHQVPHDICGKLILATHESQLPQLDFIYKRGLQNKVKGISKINADGISIYEPDAKGIAAIHVPCTGIVNFKQVTQKLVEEFLLQTKTKVCFNEEVKTIKTKDEEVTIITQKQNYTVKYAIFCAGLQADRMAKLEGLSIQMKILPFRGDYYELTESAKRKVKNLIYPVPDLKFPFLGVHLTRMVDGEVECGPNAVFNFHREGYSKTSFKLKDTLDALMYTGTFKLFKKHWRNGIGEQSRAFSKGLFLRALQELVPSLTMDDIKPARCGIRAQAVGTDGKLIDDFYFKEGRNTLHVLNAPSPAATACLAIADAIVERFKNNL